MQHKPNDPTHTLRKYLSRGQQTSGYLIDRFKHEQSQRRKQVVRRLFLWATGASLLAAILAIGIAFKLRGRTHWLLQTHSWNKLSELAQASEVRDYQNKKIGEFSDERRYSVALASLPTHVPQAVLAAEDAEFYHHHGYSFKSILRSAWANIRGGGFRQGGSTITQQLVRNLYLSKAKSLQRKIDEIILAAALEQEVGKDRILELYLNTVFFGNQAYGIEAAARNYFRKSASELSLAEASLLAGILASPSRLAPHMHLSLAKQRQRYVLQQMVDENFVDAKTAQLALNQVLGLAAHALPKNANAPYVMQSIAQELKQRVALEKQSRFGLQIYTGLDEKLQNQLQSELPKLVTARYPGKALALGDHIEAAALVIDISSADIRAMLGGRNFSQTQFNRSLMMARPLGSLFLPFYVGLALDRGYQLNSSIYSVGHQAPLVGEFAPHQDLSLFDSLRLGRAQESARLFAWLGTGTVTDAASKLGFEFARQDMALALGVGTANLLQVATALSAFTNDGQIRTPHLITMVKAKDGTPIYQTSSLHQPPIYSAEARYMIRHALAAYPWEHSLGAQGKAPQGLSFIVGTDAGLHDAWFVGFDDETCVAIWVGSEFGRRRLAESEDQLRRIVSRIWLDLYQTLPLKPSREALIPEGISFARIKSTSGAGRTLPIKTGSTVAGFNR